VRLDFAAALIQVRRAWQVNARIRPDSPATRLRPGELPVEYLCFVPQSERRRIAAVPMRLLKLLLLAACLAALTFASRSVAAAPDALLQSELKQQQLQRTTQRVATQLSAIIDEFERNGIAGEDVRVLRAIRAVLGRLGEREMTQVIALLQQARGAGDDAAVKRTVAEAYANQKGIITQFKQLLLEYQRQQALYETSILLRGLAARQSANMRVGVWLARQTEGRQAANFGEDEKRYLQQQEIDQIAIKDELGLLLNKVERIARETEGTPTGDRPKAALEAARSGGLVAALNDSVTDLKAGRLYSATGNEQRARDQMRHVARTMLMSPDLADLLRAAIQETENEILRQQQVAEFTRKIERRDDARDAEDKQFEMVDNTELIRRDINDVAPSAASFFRTAMDRMQEARSILSGGKKPTEKALEARVKQIDAVNALEQAKRELQAQLVRAEEEQKKPESVLASLRELQQQVQELIKKEEALKEQTAAMKKASELRTKAPEQGEIRDSTQEVQQKAANDAPAAAQALSEAANHMEAAQKDLAKNKNSPDAQQAAVDALKQAEQELGEKIAKLEEDEKQLAALEKLREKVEGIIKDQQKVRLDTARHAVKPDSKPAGEIAQKQQDAGNRTAEAQSEAQQPAPRAAEHLSEAKNQMASAQQKLGESKSNDAQPPQNRALNELYAAKKEIESKMNELREELGKQTDPAQSLADAAAALEKAQQDVGEAQSEMANAPAGLLDDLQKQQEAIASALEESAKSSPSQKVSKAQQAAAQAARQLAAHNLKEAVSSMQQAQQGIEGAHQDHPNAPPQGTPLPQLGQQQKQVKDLAQQLLAAQEGVGEQAMQNAAQQLEEALNEVSPIAAGEKGQLPRAAQQAVQQAQSALTQAAAQAGAQQKQPAQANAADAAQALAQAQAALALAQAGLGSQMAQGQQPGQGQGQGKSPGKGQGDGQQQSQGQGQGTPAARGDGKDGNWSGTGGANGPRRNVTGSSSFIGLPQRDRAALQQSQAERYPQEYAPLVEQYLKNLSDGGADE
jgi:hypothetical protein